MAGGDYEIEIFGKRLRYSEAKLRELRLGNFFYELQSMESERVEMLFRVAGDFDGLLKLEVEKIMELYILMYENVYKYIKSLNLPENITVEDIHLPREKETFWWKYKNWNQEIKERKNKVRQKLEEERVSFDETLKKYREYEKKEYSMMESEYKCFMTNDVYSLKTHIENLFRREHIAINVISQKECDEIIELQNALLLNPGLKDKSKSALRILESYPTIRLFPSYVIKEFPEQMDKLLQLYTFIGVNIAEEDIDKALNNLVEKMPHDTDEQTMRIKEILDNVQKLVNIQGNTAVEKMNRILEIQSRTFQGIVFQTQEERKKAEEDYIVLERKFKDKTILNEAQCNSEKKWISEQPFNHEIANIYIAKIDSRLQEIWKNEDSQKFSVLFQNMDIHSEESKNQAAKIITLIGKSSDKKRYIRAIQGMNAENISMAQKYEAWKKKSIIQKYGISWGLVGLGVLILTSSQLGFLGIAAGCIVHYLQKKEIKKQQNMWNLLTVDGKIVHKQLLEVAENKVDNLTTDKKGESQC